MTEGKQGDGVAPPERRVEDRRVESSQGLQRRTFAGLLINKALIKRYVIIVVSITMISSCLIGFVIHQTIKHTLENEFRRVEKVSVYDVLMQVNNELLFRVFVVLFLSLIATGVAGILFLHRIAGPMHRIRGVLRALVEGRIPEREVKLRQGDFFVEVTDELNRLIVKLRSDKK